MLLWLSPQHTPSTRWCLAPSSALTRTTRPGAISTAYQSCDFLKETCLEHSQCGWGAPWLLWVGEVRKTFISHCGDHFLLSMLSHIFFDDCMERASEEKGEMIVNQFVRHLINAIDEFGRKWWLPSLFQKDGSEAIWLPIIRVPHQ